MMRGFYAPDPPAIFEQMCVHAIKILFSKGLIFCFK